MVDKYKYRDRKNKTEGKQTQGDFLVKKNTSSRIMYEIQTTAPKGGGALDPLNTILLYAHGKDKLSYARSATDLRWEYIAKYIPLIDQNTLHEKLYEHIISGGEKLLTEIEKGEKRMIVRLKGKYIDLTPMTNMRDDIKDSALTLEDIYYLDQHKKDATILELGTGEGNLLHTISELGISPEKRIYIGIDQNIPNSYEKWKDGMQFMQFDLDNPETYTFLPQADLIYSDYTGQYIQNILTLLQHLPKHLNDGGVAKINVGQSDRFDGSLLQFLLENNPTIFSLGKNTSNSLYNTLNGTYTNYVKKTNTIYFTYKKGVSPNLVLPERYYTKKGVAYALPQAGGKDIIAIPAHGDKMRKYGLEPINE